VSNILFDVDGINLLFPRIYSQLNNYISNYIIDGNKINLQIQNFVDGLNYTFIDLMFDNYVTNIANILLILQLSDVGDDLIVSKIDFYMYNDNICKNLIKDKFTLKNNFIIKRFFGNNMLIIFLCENVISLKDLRNFYELVEDYQPNKLCEIISDKFIKINVYDENDKIIKYNSCIVL
jgi:hypothetical protein